MESLVNDLNVKFNIKRFIAFSFFIYPLGITTSILPLVFPGSKILLYVCSYFLFATLNWIWSQKKFNFTLLLLSAIFGTIWLSFAFNGFDTQKDLDFAPAIALLPVMFPVFLLSQFSTWVPSIINYLIKIRKNSPGIIFGLVLFAIIGYVGAALITRTIISTPTF